MTEKEKIIKGELYDASDVTLVEEHTACKILTHRHISTTKGYAKIAGEKKIGSANKITLK